MPPVEYALIASSDYRRFIRDNPIHSFAKMSGTVNGGNRVTIREFLDLQPGNADAQLAMIMAQQARVSCTPTGSALPPMVDVYVVFYEQDKLDKLALVFAVQKPSVHHIERSVNNCFITLLKYRIAPKEKAAEYTAGVRSRSRKAGR